LDAALLLLEKDAADLRTIVLQRENRCGRTGASRQFGDFALHGDVGEALGEEIADLRGEFADVQALRVG